jgi:aarF domain-containing kinase
LRRYKTLGEDFRLDYCDLWLGIALADIAEIKRVCLKMGSGKMFPLLAAMLTARPFDEILDRAAVSKGKKKGGAVEDQSGQSKGNNSMIRMYAMRYVKEIAILLDSVPRELCLLLKMQDCIRHIDSALGKPVNTLEVSARRAHVGKLQHAMTAGGGGTGGWGRLVLRVRERVRYWWSWWRIRGLFFAIRKSVKA